MRREKYQGMEDREVGKTPDGKKEDGIQATTEGKVRRGRSQEMGKERHHRGDGDLEDKMGQRRQRRRLTAPLIKGEMRQGRQSGERSGK